MIITCLFWDPLWLHFFWPTFWQNRILYFTCRGGFAGIWWIGRRLVHHGCRTEIHTQNSDEFVLTGFVAITAGRQQCSNSSMIPVAWLFHYATYEMQNFTEQIYSSSAENFERPKNREDGSNLDEHLSESIAATQTFI